jgi:hypothetical protein
VSWHGYFGDAGGLFGYPSQQEAASNYFNGSQNQMANAYNQYNSQALSGINSCWQGLQSPAVKAEPRKADCEGCGAPLKAYIHHCEYCRRAKC